MLTAVNRIVDPAATSIAFGPFRLFPMQRILTEAGSPVRLGSRAFDILLALLERAGELVTKEDLMTSVWPNTFVEPANVAVHISALRRAIGDSCQSNRYIVNIPGRGYRFVAAVSFEHDSLSPPAEEPTSEYALPNYYVQPGAVETVDGASHQPHRPRSPAILGLGGIASTRIAYSLTERLAKENSMWLVGLGSYQNQ